MLKLSDNPPILSPPVESLAEMPGRWWVAHTRARFEKAFAWDLIRRDIGYFLPMVLKVTVSGGRKRRGMKPLFGSYVFFCGGPDERYEAMRTDRVCSALQVQDQAQLIAELSAVLRALRGEAELDPHPFAVVGRRCRVVAGPFAGVEGVIQQRRSRTRLILGVSVLGRGASMEIDADLLEPMD